MGHKMIYGSEGLNGSGGNGSFWGAFEWLDLKWYFKGKKMTLFCLILKWHIGRKQVDWNQNLPSKLFLKWWELYQNCRQNSSSKT